MASSSVIKLSDIVVKSSAGRPESQYVSEFVWASKHLHLNLREDMSWEEILAVLFTIHTTLEGFSRTEWCAIAPTCLSSTLVRGDDEAIVESTTG